MYSADTLEQMRRAVGLPRAIALTEPAGVLLAALRKIDPSQLAVNERGETQRIISGVVSAMRYEGLRDSGLAVVAGWDRRAPHDPGLPVVNEYQLRNGNGREYITEPLMLRETGMRALLRLAQIGWEVTVKAAGALHLPGKTLCVAIRSNGRSHRAPG